MLVFGGLSEQKLLTKVSDERQTPAQGGNTTDIAFSSPRTCSPHVTYPCPKRLPPSCHFLVTTRRAVPGAPLVQPSMRSGIGAHGRLAKPPPVPPGQGTWQQSPCSGPAAASTDCRTHRWR